MSWATFYRPDTLDLIVGQDHIKKSLLSLTQGNGGLPHTFLLHGPSGVGKTTVARIIGSFVGCKKEPNLIEINASNHNSVDDMRDIERDIMYKVQGKNKNKFYIFDEAHQITKQAFQSLLKPIEEPPDHVYFVFVTTEPSKIPKTIESRCHTYKFDEVSSKDILLLLQFINLEEGLDLDDYLKLIAKSSEGSPRKAINALSKCRGLNSKEDISKIMETVDEKKNVIDFCRCLLPSSDTDYSTAIGCLNDITDVNPETIRIIVLNYFVKGVFKSKGNISRFLDVLHAFNTTPLDKSTGFADLILSTRDLF